MFECRQLVVRYAQSNEPAVRGVSFDIQSGEIVSLVGESGSGKSSVAYAVGRLLRTDVAVEGEIRISGKNLLTLNHEQIDAVRRKDLAFIFQDPTTSLNPLMTIRRQFISAMIEPSHHNELLRQVELKDVDRILSAYPHELSGGMKQRLMIAMAISKKPKLIIADEPTASLDATIAADVMNRLKTLSVQNRCAMLLITHDLKMARKFSDRTLFMRAGKVVGTLDGSAEYSGGGYIQQLINASTLNQKPKTRICVEDV